MTATDKIRVMIVDDHPLIRVGLRQIIDVTPDIEIVAEADSGVDALRMLDTTAIDVIVLDMAMPGRNGVEILRRMCDRGSRPPVLVYSRFSEEQYAVRTVRAGAAGYLMKSAAPTELVTAVRRLAAGEKYLSPRIARLIEEGPRRSPAHPHDALSEREFEVLRMIVGGKTVSRIAIELSLSIKTVSTHRTRILRKLGLSSTADLIHYAIEHGIDD